MYISEDIQLSVVKIHQSPLN